MPKTKAASRVETRLHPKDFKDLECLSCDPAKTKGRVVREAILW